jgi:hypothetical protein
MAVLSHALFRPSVEALLSLHRIQSVIVSEMDAGYRLLSGIEVRNAWSVDFTAPCFFMAQCFKA